MEQVFPWTLLLVIFSFLVILIWSKVYTLGLYCFFSNGAMTLEGQRHYKFHQLFLISLPMKWTQAHYVSITLISTVTPQSFSLYLCYFNSIPSSCFSFPHFICHAPFFQITLSPIPFSLPLFLVSRPFLILPISSPLPLSLSVSRAPSKWCIAGSQTLNDH